MEMPPGFMLVLRGYDRAQVEALTARGLSALDSKDQALRSRVSAELREAAFQIRMRGYDRRQVDDYLNELRARLLEP